MTLPEGPIVNVEWLYQNRSEVKIIEAKMKPIGASDDWETGQKLPGAVLMDINEDFSRTDTDLPHMMPSPAYFSEAAANLGLNAEDILVIYDQTGTYASPRGWWMMRAMGHEKTFVLDGGIRAWMAKGYETEMAQWPALAKGNFEAKLQNELLYLKEDVLAVLDKKTHTIMDARSQGRFDATAPEPRAGLIGGHIPGSACLPFQQVQNGWYMKTAEELKEIFAQFELHQTLLMSCGSGVTASILALAAEIAGYKNAAVYDGSWAEWGMPSEQLPIEAKI